MTVTTTTVEDFAVLRPSHLVLTVPSGRSTFAIPTLQMETLSHREVTGQRQGHQANER